jgi:hypothetical protein
VKYHTSALRDWLTEFSGPKFFPLPSRFAFKSLTELRRKIPKDKNISDEKDFS